MSLRNRQIQGNLIESSISLGRRPLHGSQSHFTNSVTSQPEGFTQIRSRSPDNQTKEKTSSRISLLVLVAVFCSALCLLYITYKSFPNMTQEEKVHLKIPRNIEDAKQLGIVLTKYKLDHYYQVLFAVTITYIFLQSFAIPGTIFLVVLSGYLFPVYTALALSCTCSAVGASFCYLLTYFIGRKLVLRLWPDRVSEWSKHVENHKEHMLNYIIFLRITPFLPNWFINVASPVINVQWVPFVLGTFIGVAPTSFLLIETGTTLYDMTESDSNFTWGRVLFLGSLAFLSILPVIFKKKLRSRLE